MNTNTNETYEIVNGPSKDALFDACKYVYNSEVKLKINFAVAIGYTMKPGDPGCAYIPMKIKNMRIVGIEHEDGSGEKLNLRGYCDAVTSLDSLDNTAFRPFSFRAFYDAKRRKGHIVFIE